MSPAERLLLDTNVLVLLIIGIVNRSRIETFKRTRKYTAFDLDVLTEVTGGFRTLYSTPHVLAEVSNLTDLAEPELKRARSILRQTISALTEPSTPSATAAAERSYDRLGLTAASIHLAARENSCTVLTDDLQLYLSLVDAGLPAINFSHVLQQRRGL